MRVEGVRGHVDDELSGVVRYHDFGRSGTGACVIAALINVMRDNEILRDVCR